MIATWHTEITNNELRQECKVEAKEDQYRADLTPDFAVHPAGHLRPPEVQSSQEAHRRSTNHHVMEVRNNKVCCRQVDISSE